MSANCATWTSERIELLKRCLHAGLSCSQIAREIGVTRNAVIGKMNRLRSRPKDVIGRQLQQRRAIRLAGPKAHIFAQHEMLMAAFPRPQPAAEVIPIHNGRGCTLLELSQGKCRWPIGKPGAQDFCFCGTSQSKDCPIAWGTRALHIGRLVGSAAARVREHTTVAAPPRDYPAPLPRQLAKGSALARCKNKIRAFAA